MAKKGKYGSVASSKPINRLTLIGDKMLDAFKKHSEEGDQVIILVGDEHSTGMAIYGYERSSEVAADLLLSAKVMLKRDGKTMKFATQGDDGGIEILDD